MGEGGGKKGHTKRRSKHGMGKAFKQTLRGLAVRARGASTWVTIWESSIAASAGASQPFEEITSTTDYGGAPAACQTQHSCQAPSSGR